MKVYVSGATGFVGSHVARELREQGADVRNERVDLLDRAALEEAVAGCEAVVHVAALYSFDAPAAEIERVNVEGTRNLLDAAAQQRVRRFLFTSTAGTCGPVPGRLATEDDEPPAWELSVPYKRTKIAAERLALAAGAVVVNPTAPIGDGDRKPTPTGRMVVNVAHGRMPGFVRTTGLNLVDVRDVARAHALALERGEPGERYILGGVNLPLEEIFAAIADLAGRRRPRLRVPYAVAQAAAKAGFLNADEVKLARLPMYFSSDKARVRLDYTPGPVEPALARAVAEALNADGKEAA
ncbi:MAG TPA: NAD-dependent epimerase/dehydratase family protein [Gaiellaceae bacterium]|jgi:dihydroflavonol-4-reductase|nr:NAD-dependent epimerase/dehydratase family protein [Gaiellaceae bacterium]